MIQVYIYFITFKTAYDARIKHQKETQKQWIEQQIREKRMRDEAEKNEEKAYST